MRELRFTAFVIVGTISFAMAGCPDTVVVHDSAGAVTGTREVDWGGRNHGVCVDYWPNGRIKNRICYSHGLFVWAEHFNEDGELVETK